jgi:hypothetical protein
MPAGMGGKRLSFLAEFTHGNALIPDDRAAYCRYILFSDQVAVLPLMVADGEGSGCSLEESDFSLSVAQATKIAPNKTNMEMKWTLANRPGRG